MKRVVAFYLSLLSEIKFRRVDFIIYRFQVDKSNTSWAFGLMSSTISRPQIPGHVSLIEILEIIEILLAEWRPTRLFSESPLMIFSRFKSF